jgi:hypothetical protein
VNARPYGALALAALLALSLGTLTSGRRAIEAALASPKGAQAMVASDSRHYLDIAEAIARGDCSLDYVTPVAGRDRAHRQPLYPALLALVMRVHGSEVRGLAMLNVVFVVASMWVAYAIGAVALRSRLAGLAGALIVWKVPFLWENATTRLLTEPSYVFLSLVLGLCFLGYLMTRRAGWLYAAASTAALCYLDRVNGLFTGVLALACLAAADFLIGRRDAARTDSTGAPGVWRHHAIGAAIFLAVAIPSWVPRLVHTGNPLYHGYLSNYLWVDEYEKAHVPGPPRYGWRDYARDHDAGAALARVRYGLRRALWSAPREKYGDLVAACMLAGLVVTALARKRALVAWYAVGLAGVLPLAWTALANPIRRIPATALLAFGVVAVAGGTALGVAAAARVLAARRHSGAFAPDP